MQKRYSNWRDSDNASGLVRREIQTEAYEMIKGWSMEDHQHLRDSVPSTGLKTPFHDGTVQDVAKQVMRQFLLS